MMTAEAYRIGRYVHGFSPREQSRLVEQARFWRDALIVKGSHFSPGTRLLEIGCGAGAVLRVLGEAYPGLALEGLDREPQQLQFARRHLRALGQRAKLRLGDALAIPLPDRSYDEAWMMWFLEHVPDPVATLREAWRVLKPGGGLTAIETDYASLEISRPTPAFRAMRDAFCALFNLNGRASTGPRLAEWLADAGFERVSSPSLGFTFTQGPKFKESVGYFLGFIEPALPAMQTLRPAGARQIAKGLREFSREAGRYSGWVRLDVRKARAYRPA